MKTTRIILIIIGWLWIAIVGALSVENFIDFANDPMGGDLTLLIGILLGMALFAFPSFILFFIAKKIRKKMEKKQRQELMNSFENI